MSLFAISCLALLLVVGSALGVVAAMVRAHRAAQSAADLAALAAASALARGREPCAAGEAVAVANGASLTGCVVVGRDVVVEAEMAGPRWLGQRADLSAEARAGPAALSSEMRRARVAVLVDVTAPLGLDPVELL